MSCEPPSRGATVATLADARELTDGGVEIPRAGLSMVCLAGSCVVPMGPAIVEVCRNELDPCPISFCNQPTSRTANCVNTLCPQAGTCCCEAPGNPAQRSCVNMNS